jgi:hypothetical protein
MSRFALALLLLPAPAFAQEADKAGIDRALSFLATMQDRDGAWTAFNQKHPAITGLAVMAFLSAGHVPGEGPYQANVDKGIRWVLDQQQSNGLFASDNWQEMYHHGICTLMLCEVVGMTDAATSKSLKPKLEKAVKLILQAQRTEQGINQGGWRYRIESLDADMSVTGWQILALRAAKNVGCDVPAERIDLALDFVRRCRDPRTGGYCYLPGARLTSACTGTGILALELAGKDLHRDRDSLQAGGYLLRNPVKWNDEHFFYTSYYTAQAMFQLGGNYWQTFRPSLHKALLDNQQRNGCWIGNEGFGPNYATSMAVLALAVEHRFLPIYQRNEDVPKAK